jgi:hypothetical protein
MGEGVRTLFLNSRAPVKREQELHESWRELTSEGPHESFLNSHSSLKQGLGSARSSEQAPFTSEIVELRTHMTLKWKESVNALPKVVGFLRVLRFPPTGKVDRVGFITNILAGRWVRDWTHRGCHPRCVQSRTHLPASMFGFYHMPFR